MRAGGARGIEFAVLAEADDGPPAEHLTEAERIYGGPLRFPDARRPYLYGNFVSSIDGVVSVGLADGTDSSTISGREAADRFLMALLRAASDVVLIGAGTLRATPGHRWTSQALFPDDRSLLDEYRASQGRTGEARLAIVSGSGDLPDHVALRNPATPAIVLTTEAGAERARKLGAAVRVITVARSGAIDGAAIVAALQREMDATHVLCEGGPSLMGTLVRARSLSELFITVSPRLAGRDGVRERRGLIDGWAPGPDSLVRATLLSVRRSGDHVLLRYSLS